MALSREDRQAIEAAFEKAQAATGAPLMGVVAEASSDYAVLPLAASLLLALAAPWPLLVFTSLSAERVFASQLAVCVVALLAFSFPRARVALISRRVRRAVAHRAALVQYDIRGLDRAPGRDGVLIYASLSERYARAIVGDHALRRVATAEWQALIDALTADMAKGSARDALCAAAERAAGLMSPHFPAGASGAPRSPRFHAI